MTPSPLERVSDAGSVSDARQCCCYVCLSKIPVPDDPLGRNRAQMYMVTCPKCGNKRCPHATYHAELCTNSNEPGQPGSRYE